MAEFVLGGGVNVGEQSLEAAGWMTAAVQAEVRVQEMTRSEMRSAMTVRTLKRRIENLLCWRYRLTVQRAKMFKVGILRISWRMWSVVVEEKEGREDSEGARQRFYLGKR